MPQFLFKLPDVGEGVAEAEVVAWHVAPGDLVEEDQPLVDVMTDKATVEITSPVAGRVQELHGDPGSKVAIGSTLVVFDIVGAGSGLAAPAETAAPARANTVDIPILQMEIPPDDRAKPLASPTVRRRAAAVGVSLESLRGSGPDGRIDHADLDAYLHAHIAAGRGAAACEAVDRVEEIKVIGLRRRIAEKMTQSKRSIPHFSYIEEVDVTELEALRVHLNAGEGEARGRLTILPLFIRGMIVALRDFPQLNAVFDSEAGVVRRHSAVHLGLATQTAGGLMVPVLRHAEALGLWSLAQEIERLAGAARAGTAGASELSGSTITVTSLGRLGGVAHTPVINHPEVAIVGPNRVVDRPVVHEGAVAVRKMMNISSSFDHRVVDGHDAASFVGRLKGLLEHPGAIFAE